MHKIQFSAPGKVELMEDRKGLPSGSLLIRNQYSLISPGTELAILSGGESWAPLPYVPGYGAVGFVEQSGSSGLKKGSMVFTYGKHASLIEDDTICLPLPENIDPVHAVFARIGAVSMTAIRVSEIELGDRVCVVGAGLVGNLAAQLAALSGAHVCIVDPSAQRLKIAEECGILETALSIGQLPGNKNADARFETVIDATGIPFLPTKELDLVAPQGELILLGSPRGDYQGNLTNLLNKIHLCPDVITLKGAHEWRLPVFRSDANHYKHSIERNLKVIFRLIENGTLNISPLLTQKVSPEQCQSVYDGLQEQKDEYMGVVFDWRKF